MTIETSFNFETVRMWWSSSSIRKCYLKVPIKTTLGFSLSSKSSFPIEINLLFKETIEINIDFTSNFWLSLTAHRNQYSTLNEAMFSAGVVVQRKLFSPFERKTARTKAGVALSWFRSTLRVASRYFPLNQFDMLAHWEDVLSKRSIRSTTPFSYNKIKNCDRFKGLFQGLLPGFISVRAVFNFEVIMW